MFLKVNFCFLIIHVNDLQEWKSDLFLDESNYRVEKMTFGNRNKDKTQIIYNSKITLSGIPLEAYEYIVNGK